MKITTPSIKEMMRVRQEWDKMNELEFHGGSVGFEVPSVNEEHAWTKSHNTLAWIWIDMILSQRYQDPNEIKSPKGEKENSTGRPSRMMCKGHLFH